MLDGLKAPVVEASVDKADPADAVPEALSQTVASPRGIWICGNSLKSVTYDRLLQGVLVDLVVQDSPFNVSVKKHGGGLRASEVFALGSYNSFVARMSATKRYRTSPRSSRSNAVFSSCGATISHSGRIA